MPEPTLLTGPYDWDPALMPRGEYESRLAAVRDVLRARGLSGLIVGGHSPEHGALCYLTGFVPKLGPALAFVPLEGDLRVAFSGGPAMLPSAKRLTFVDEVRALREAETDVARWFAAAGNGRLGLWGENAIPYATRRAIDRAAASAVMVLDEILDALRRPKSPVELALLRRAARILEAALAELRRGFANGMGARSAALAAERAAYAQGAQDVRMLMSRRDAGIPEPVDAAHDPRVDPLLACMAVRFAGYWAEGWVTLASAASAVQSAVERALATVLNDIRPGRGVSALAATVARRLSPWQPHPLVGTSFGNGIGVSRAEAPLLALKSEARLQDGDVLTLRIGATDGGRDNAIASVMVRVGAHGPTSLWPQASG